MYKIVLLYTISFFFFRESTHPNLTRQIWLTYYFREQFFYLIYLQDSDRFFKCVENIVLFATQIVNYKGDRFIKIEVENTDEKL